MPKMHRGATMLELIAVLLLTSMVFFGAYTSIETLFDINSRTSRITKDQNMFAQLSTALTRELSRATQMIFVENTNTNTKQWRYKKEKKMYAFTLTKNSDDDFYTLSRGLLENQNAFSNPSIASYTELDVLAQTITSMDMRIIPPEGAHAPLVGARIYTNREVISITINRARGYFGADNARAADRETLTSTFTVQLDADDADIETSTYKDRISTTTLGKSIANTYVPMRTIPLSSINSIPLGTTDVNDTISLPDVVVAETEMTYATWYSVRKIMENKGYNWDNAGKEGSIGQLGAEPGAVTGAHPVTSITWNDVIVWLNAWSELHGLNPVYRDLSGDVVKQPRDIEFYHGKLNVVRSRDNGYRLPTNNEWEAVARWYGKTNPGNDYSTSSTPTSTSSPSGDKFYWQKNDQMSGKRLDIEPAWFDVASTQIVRTKNKNGADLYDMSGNVSEMTDVDSLRYLNIVQTSTRGGSWKNNPGDDGLKVSKKTYASIDATSNTMGFRPFATYVPKQIIGYLDLLPAPERTKKALMSFETEQYTASVVWTTNSASSPIFDTDNQFKSNTEYVATVTLKPKNGYSLLNLGSDHFTAPGASNTPTTTYATDIFGSRTEATIKITYPQTEQVPNNELDIKFKPIAGENSPPFDKTWTIPNPNDPTQTMYTITVLDWSNHAHNIPFGAGKVYTLVAKIEAAPGQTLPDATNADNQSYFIVPTAQTTTYKKSNTGIDVIEITFKQTETTIKKSININKPKENDRPQQTITDEQQFNGTIEWTDENNAVLAPTDRFNADTKYTAKITLTPKEGYTVYGVHPDYFEVKNASSTTNEENKNIVTATFDIAPKTYTIEGLQTRATHRPAKTIDTNTLFKIRDPITWNGQGPQGPGLEFQCSPIAKDPPYDCTFKPNYTYTAKFTLIFKPPFDTSKLKSGSFNVENANTTTYNPVTNEIIAEFPKILPLSTEQIIIPATLLTSSSDNAQLQVPNIPPDTTNVQQCAGKFENIPATTNPPLGISDISLDAFEIGKSEVHYGLWFMIRDETEGKEYGYTFNNPGQAGSAGTVGEDPTNANQFEPVTNITWRDMIVWLNAYSEYDGLSPVYSITNVVVRDTTVPFNLDDLNVSETANGYRLPTNDEWEVAARGLGTWPGNRTDYISVTVANKTTYWLKSDYASGAENSTTNVTETNRVAVIGDGTKTICSKNANANDIFDMSGNVAERTFDQKIRGGHFTSTYSELGVGNTFPGDAGGASSRNGFRIAKNYTKH